jgi:hypothetical protein
MEHENKEYTLRIINTSEKIEGWLFIKKGTLIDAICGAKMDLEAVKKIFSWGSVDIELYNICPLSTKRIDVDTSTLVLQCAEIQQAGECPASVTAPEKFPKATPKPVGGLAGLFLKKAKKN